VTQISASGVRTTVGNLAAGEIGGRIAQLVGLLSAPTVSTTGQASETSRLAARISCARQGAILSHGMYRNVRLVAAYPTVLSSAWEWAFKTPAPSSWSSVSAKVCLFSGSFREGPPVGGPPKVDLSSLPILPAMAVILAPNGRGGGIELKAWPSAALPVRNLHPDRGLSNVHWAPW
jgi:hypothetical protein